VPSTSSLSASPRITICGIPELGEHSAAGVTHVLSILAPDWPDPETFADFPPHRRLLLRFNDIIDPIPDGIAPNAEDVAGLLAFGRELDATPDGHLLIHCHAGVSRSTAAAVLILAQAEPLRSAREVLEAVVAIRPRAWPNLRMLELGDAMLGRNGELVAAVGPIYRRVIERDPAFRDMMLNNGREREVQAALAASLS
jgi:predicted protein tyrosine phosphatase